MSIRLRPESIARYGFRPVEVMDAVETAYQGAVVAQTYDKNRTFDVSVILDAAERSDPESVGRLLIDNGQGMRVPLGELADVYQTTGRFSVLHDGTRRRQAVTSNVHDRDVASFVDEVTRRIHEKVSFPSGTYAVVGGSDEARVAAQREIPMSSGVALIGIMLLLSMVFRNARNLTLVLVNLPFALVGGVLAVLFTGAWLTVGSIVGFVTLFGITTRNSIMMISHFEHLVVEEGLTWGPETAVRGALERLAPVLMTALVTAFGLLPLALGAGSPGREIEGPMAIVILGGLATSTLLNLLVLPALAARYGRFRPRAAEV